MEMEDKEINEIMTKDFIKQYENKQLMKWYRNISTIMKTETQTTEDKLEILKHCRYCNKHTVHKEIK